MPPTLRVTAVILNYNGLSETLECLASMGKIRYPDCPVIVVDNGSGGDDVRVLRELHGNHVQIIQNGRNIGLAAGYNVGINEALKQRSEFVLILHNDVIVGPTFLDELVRTAADSVRAGILGPKVYYRSDPARIWSVGWSRNLWTGIAHMRGDGHLDAGQFDTPVDVGCVSTCCMLVRSQVFREVGLLDERFLLGFAEEDLCLRARKAGWRVIVAPGAQVWHACHSTSRRGGFASPQVIADAIRGYLLFTEKHASPIQRLTSTVCRICYVPQLFPDVLRGASLLSTLHSYIAGITDYVRRRFANPQ